MIGPIMILRPAQAAVPSRDARDFTKAHVPDEVPGIVFLSGGMTDEDSTSRLNEINRQGGGPWEISFSYGRALQAHPLRAWGGNANNVEVAQAALAHRARMNGLARDGEWSPAMEGSAA